MHRRILLFVLSLAWLLGFSPSPTVAQSFSCANFDAWVWAQSAYAHGSTDDRLALDPDQNSVACDQLRGIEGFSPALWTNKVPDGLDVATFSRDVDGDSFYAVVNGVEEEIRLYRTDAPEMSPLECGAGEATAKFMELLSYNDSGLTFSIEHDKTLRDQYDRMLAYMWLVIDGQPYLMNEALVRSGWAEDKDYGDRLYASQMQEAAQFAKMNNVGAYGLCGPLGPATGTIQPTPYPTVAIQNSSDGNVSQAPSGSSGSAANLSGDCDPSYPDFCLAPAWQIGDLDCGDIGYRRFTVYPPDSHNFDGDHDGVGCESG